MEPADKNLYDMVRENNILLKKMHRREQFRNIASLIKFAFIVVLIIWSYMYIQPYLEKMLQLYSDISQGTEQMKNISGGFNFDPDAIKQLFAQ